MRLREAQERWLTALESGDYEQTTRRLRRWDAYCCLGVACDVSQVEGEWVRRQGVVHGTPAEYWVWCDGSGVGLAAEGLSGILSDAVCAELAMDSNGGFRGDTALELFTPEDQAVLSTVEIVDDEAEPWMVRVPNCLTDLNDAGWGFKEIAGLIRRNPEAFFEPEERP